jgi:hypothetical protein
MHMQHFFPERSSPPQPRAAQALAPILAAKSLCRLCTKLHNPIGRAVTAGRVARRGDISRLNNQIAKDPSADLAAAY